MFSQHPEYMLAQHDLASLAHGPPRGNQHRGGFFIARLVVEQKDFASRHGWPRLSCAGCFSLNQKEPGYKTAGVLSSPSDCRNDSGLPPPRIRPGVSETTTEGTSNRPLVPNGIEGVAQRASETVFLTAHAALVFPRQRVGSRSYLRPCVLVLSRLQNNTDLAYGEEERRTNPHCVGLLQSANATCWRTQPFGGGDKRITGMLC